MKLYSLFGLSIWADIPCGEPSQAPISDIEISQDIVPAGPPPGSQLFGPFVGYTDSMVWQTIPGVIRMQATADRIRWQADKRVSDPFVLEFLLHLGIPYILANHGYFTCLGIAIRIDDHAIIIPNSSQSFRSELLSELLRLGVCFFSEGLCAVRQNSSGDFNIFPGLTRIYKTRLPNKTDGAEFKRIRQGIAFGYLKSNDFFSAAPHILTDIIQLQSERKESCCKIKNAHGMSRVDILTMIECLPFKIIGEQVRKQLWGVHMAIAKSINIASLIIPGGNEEPRIGNFLLKAFSCQYPKSQ